MHNNVCVNQFSTTELNFEKFVMISNIKVRPFSNFKTQKLVLHFLEMWMNKGPQPPFLVDYLNVRHSLSLFLHFFQVVSLCVELLNSSWLNKILLRFGHNTVLYEFKYLEKSIWENKRLKAVKIITTCCMITHIESDQLLTSWAYKHAGNIRLLI